MLLDNRLDLAMIEAPIEHRDLTGEPFSRDELVLILPPNHALLQKDRLTLADVAACDLLLREKGSSGRAFLDTVFEAHDLSVSPLWESASTEALVRAVAAGIGLSILPERRVARAHLPHRLAPKQIPFPVAQAADRADPRGMSA